MGTLFVILSDGAYEFVVAYKKPRAKEGCNFFLKALRAACMLGEEIFL